MPAGRLTVRHALDQSGLALFPRRVTAARWRRSTDQHLDARAAELGFASLRAYLTDRATTRQWPSTVIAEELGVDPATVRDRLDHTGCRADGRPSARAGRSRGRAGLLDELCLTLSPRLIGGDTKRILDGPSLLTAGLWRLHSLCEQDDYLFLRYRPR